MHNATAHSTYSKTSQSTSSPRDLEAHLLLKAASKLQAIKDSWGQNATSTPDSTETPLTLEEQLSDNRKLWGANGTHSANLAEALLYNRKLWTIFVTSVTSQESQLPVNVRENIANLGIFVFKRTLDVEAGPLPEKLNALIDINRNVAAGLRGQA